MIAHRQGRRIQLREQTVEHGAHYSPASGRTLKTRHGLPCPLSKAQVLLHLLDPTYNLSWWLNYKDGLPCPLSKVPPPANRPEDVPLGPARKNRVVK
jgi:hypothetical protein